MVWANLQGYATEQVRNVEQYEMLLRCSNKADTCEWNNWRKANQSKDEINLQGANLNDLNLDGIDLSDANLMGADLRKVRLNGANLSGSSLKKALLDEAHLTGADLNGACLAEISAHLIHFEGAKHIETDWRNAQLRSPFFANASFDRANLNEAQLEYANLRDASLVRTQLVNANLQNADMQRVTISGANLKNANLKQAILQNSVITDTDMNEVDLLACNLRHSRIYMSSLQNADLMKTGLEGTEFIGNHLEGADFRMAVVDGSTLLLNCTFDNKTDFRGSGMANLRIPESDRYFLEYNIRRINWQDWYENHKWLQLPVKMFWMISDYGYSTWRIILVFAGSVLFFAVVYAVSARLMSPLGIVDRLPVEPHSPKWHFGLVTLIRPVYFSIVTMTTLGFGDIRANPRSILGHLLVIIQVIWGYFLLGALITRLGILFTSGGPGL